MFSQPSNAADLVDPDVELVSSGPMQADRNGSGSYRYRIVAVLSEVDLHLYAEKIVYGDENCCAQAVCRIDPVGPLDPLECGANPHPFLAY